MKRVTDKDLDYYAWTLSPDVNCVCMSLLEHLSLPTITEAGQTFRLKNSEFKIMTQRLERKDKM